MNMPEEAVLKEFEAILGMICVRHPSQPKAVPNLETVAVLALAPVTQ